MGLFGLGKKDGGMLNVIRCDEPSYLIWKWHPAGAQPGESKRENAIRFGSSLRVKDGEVAVFVYKQKDGTYQDFIEGPFDQKLETKNLPVLSNVIGWAFGGDTPFQAEIYFINLAKVVQTRFGVPFFDVYDPRLMDFGVPVAVRGTISFRIKNYREFIKLHRLVDFSLDNFEKQISDVVKRYVKDAVTNAPSAHNIPVFQIESKIAEINDAVELDVKDRLSEDFGVEVTGVDIGAIEIDKTSEGYKQLAEVTKGIAGQRIHAEVEDYIERLRIQREEGQYEQHKRTQSEFLGAFKTEKQAEVGIAGAEALGHMGENGAGSVNLGGGGGEGGFNPAAMMAGMALGGAVGQNIAGTMNSMMSGTNQGATAPPPVPTEEYHVVINGEAKGPFSIADLSKMASAKQLTVESLVWKPGMTEWSKARNIDSLKDMIGRMTPPEPPKI